MAIQIKDGIKFIAISIISCCAVFVCTLFMNFNIDIVRIKELISKPEVMAFYDAQVTMSKVTCAVSGGCLLLTSVIMLFFYIKQYIDSHRRELGILKALGYSNIKIAKEFWVFGLSVFTGCSLGMALSFAIMPLFYRVMNEDKILPEVPLHFNLILALYLIMLPTVFFSGLAIIYSYKKLKRPVLELLMDKGKDYSTKKNRKVQKDGQQSFIQDLKQATVKGRPALMFFIALASFCYSSMMQMSFCMDEVSSMMFAIILITIGIILSCTTLFLAITTVVNANTQSIAVMQAFGYSWKDCGGAILGGYRPLAYIGFAIGTIYQYVLMKTMINIFSKTAADIPEYKFDTKSFIVVLISFVIIYELVMRRYSARIKKISIKEIMMKVT